MVADRHSHAAYQFANTDDELLTNANINNLE